MNNISFPCHIFAELKDKSRVGVDLGIDASIWDVLRLMRDGKVSIDVPNTNFYGEGPVILIKEKQDEQIA